MGNFLGAAFGYPTAIYTALLGLVLFYWILALVGVVDFESGGIDLDLQADTSVDDLGALAGFIVAFGLSGVPFSVVVSLLVLIGWTLSCLAGEWLLPLVPTVPLQWLAGTLVLLGSFALALPATAVALRPMRRMFVTHRAASNASLVGQRCTVTTSSVTPTFGQAAVARRGADIQIDVGAAEPNALTRGATARIIDYDPATQRYAIEAEA
ncbi:hypothetical protein [Rhizobacter sp. Root1221]|uniref:hypothetical protein n=1 Tax=Rhizobacter sp. Root1221 TaxID=1736433 RepID=UPI0006F5DF19|nr:hypothetical protein [Rhizobacter sp. Root1221]KQV95964.1 ubiquinone biosynthesis protein [Rhizobacter sp. Root1221]